MLIPTSLVPLDEVLTLPKADLTYEYLDGKAIPNHLPTFAILVAKRNSYFYSKLGEPLRDLFNLNGALDCNPSPEWLRF